MGRQWAGEQSLDWAGLDCEGGEGSSMLIGKFYDCLRADHVRSLPAEGPSSFSFLLCFVSSFFFLFFSE